MPQNHQNKNLHWWFSHCNSTESDIPYLLIASPNVRNLVILLPIWDTKSLCKLRIVRDSFRYKPLLIILSKRCITCIARIHKSMHKIQTSFCENDSYLLTPPVFFRNGRFSSSAIRLMRTPTAVKTISSLPESNSTTIISSTANKSWSVLR